MAPRHCPLALRFGRRGRVWRGTLRVMLEFLALGSDPDTARDVARATGGVAYLSTHSQPGDRPFASVVRVATADLGLLQPAADIGLYVVFSRAMRQHPARWTHDLPTPGLVAAFALVRRSELSHVQADAHWRDTHAPLALRIHIGMWDYTQCSVVHRLSGLDIDGVALCGFGSEADLRERFFDGPDGQRAIAEDVAKFADTSRSGQRVLCREWSFR